MTALDAIPETWRELLADQAARLAELQDFVTAERAAHTVFPPAGRVFAALAATSPDRVRAVIVGHHDLNPHKACPCIDAAKEYADLQPK